MGMASNDLQSLREELMEKVREPDGDIANTPHREQHPLQTNLILASSRSAGRISQIQIEFRDVLRSVQP